MKQASWKDCKEDDTALKITPDKAKAKSLFQTAKARIKFLKENDISEGNCNFIFEGYYSSALEMMHAIVLQEGYKVLNHACLGYYMRDVLDNKKLYRIFDDCRYKRNSLVYYGKEMGFETAKKTIGKTRQLIAELKKIYRN